MSHQLECIVRMDHPVTRNIERVYRESLRRVCNRCARHARRIPRWDICGSRTTNLRERDS